MARKLTNINHESNEVLIARLEGEILKAEFSRKCRLEYANKILDMEQNEFRKLSYVNPHSLEELMELLLEEEYRLTTAISNCGNPNERDKLELEFDALDDRTDLLQTRINDAYNT